MQNVHLIWKIVMKNLTNFTEKLSNDNQITESDLKIRDGSQIAVIGGGPAGSFFSYFTLDMAERMGTDIKVDVYEPRDFFSPSPKGCNMCGGIISETLVQMCNRRDNITSSNYTKRYRLICSSYG